MGNALLHTKRTRAKGRTYWYFDTGTTDAKGKRIWERLPDPKDRGFGAKYASLLGHRTRRKNLAAELTVTQLIGMFQSSPQYVKLSDATRKIYGIYLAEFTDQLGEAPAARLERQDVVKLLDTMGAKPGASNMVLASLRSAYSWARKRGHVEIDPCRDIDALDLGEHDPWPAAALQAALTAEDDRVRLAVHLLYYTAQRIGDVSNMRWTDIDGDRITVRQQKTKRAMEIMMHSDLIAELARHPRSLSTIIPGLTAGKALPVPALRNTIQKFCAGQGFKIVPHGLRKNAVNALLEAGCSVAETASISGQSLSMVEHYAKMRSQKTLGDSAILKWQAKGKKA